MKSEMAEEERALKKRENTKIFKKLYKNKELPIVDDERSSHQFTHQTVL